MTPPRSLTSLPLAALLAAAACSPVFGASPVAAPAPGGSASASAASAPADASAGARASASRPAGCARRGTASSGTAHATSKVRHIPDEGDPCAGSTGVSRTPSP